MTLADLTELIEPLLNEMQELTLAAGVPASQYDSVREVDPETITLDEMSDRLRFLQAVRAEQYQDVLKIWRLLSPEVWSMYTLMGVTKLREQVLLRAARKKLKSTWRRKYGAEAKATESSEHQEGPAGELV